MITASNYLIFYVNARDVAFQYVFLQQTAGKFVIKSVGKDTKNNRFDTSQSAPLTTPKAGQCKMYKQLEQPLIDNALGH